MRVICWNIHQSKAAWNYAVDSLGGDVLIFQESKKPPADPKMPSIFDTILEDEPGAMKPRTWGNSTSVLSGSIERVDVGSKYKGSLNTAVITTQGERKIGIANIYGLLEKYPDQPNPVVYLGIHRKLDKVERWINGELDPKPEFFIVCGDFNNDRRMDEHKTFKGSKQGRTSNELLDRVVGLGMTDLLAVAYPDFVQTIRHNRSKFPWQLDHFFVSNHAASLVTNIEVIDNPKIRQISDHNPIVVDFELT